MSKRKKGNKKGNKNNRKKNNRNKNNANIENKINNEGNSDNIDNDVNNGNIDNDTNEDSKRKRDKNRRDRIKRQVGTGQKIQSIIEQIMIQQQALKDSKVDLESLKKDMKIEDDDEVTTETDLITRISEDLTGINEIRRQLAILNYNVAAKEFYNEEVQPLITAIEFLAFASESFSTSARNLQQISFSKESRIKQAICLTYDLDDISEDIVDVLEGKIKQWVEIYKKGS